jgi:hypothetical protein
MMRRRITTRAAARALVGLPTVAALALMLFNDHLLKGWFPGWITGKSSDFAFLFFAPIVVVFVMRARSRLAILACYALPTATFVAINLSPAASNALAEALSLLVPTQLWPDPSDLIALVSLPVSLSYLVRQRNDAEIGRSIQMIVTATAAFGCMATSPRRDYVAIPPTHEPVYMSWEELRSAGQVLPPRSITTRGKLLIAHDHLFISEPRRGVHVFDNRDPQAPVPVMFIAIPGNIDIAVLDNRLYADSYVDLLTFELDLDAGSARLIGQLENQFHNAPGQWLDEEDRRLLRHAHIDPSKGIVIGLVPLEPALEGAVQ